MQGNAAAPGILNAEVLKNEMAYSQAFSSARPFRHVVIDNFLSEEFCTAVCDQFPVFDEKRALNEDGYIGGKATQEKVRALGPAFRQLDEIVQQQSFLSLVERITGVSGLCYDRFYYGGGTHENRQGQSLDPHVDFNIHPITRQHRRLNLVIYLNEEWDDSWGGSLQLHQDPYLEPDQDRIVTVTPLLNRCVIFETNEHSWHGFEAINLPAERQNLSRKSFALYFYTDERP
ncbi:2OG-Fe(II) oxygenase, partial [Pseudomonadota bacterium]